MKFLMLLVLIAFLVSDAPAVTVTALDITVTDCTAPPNRGEHGHIYVNYADAKYQQVVDLSLDTSHEGCALLRSGAWHHDGEGEATIISGLIEWDGGYEQIGGLPMTLDVIYLPLVWIGVNNG